MISEYSSDHSIRILAFPGYNISNQQSHKHLTYADTAARCTVQAQYNRGRTMVFGLLVGSLYPYPYNGIESAAVLNTMYTILLWKRRR